MTTTPSRWTTSCRSPSRPKRSGGARRGATEAFSDPSLRFVRYHAYVLPELGPVLGAGGPETREDLIGSPAADAAFGAIMAVRPEDPVQLRLDAVSASKRIGTIFTGLEIPDDYRSAAAVATLRVLGGNDVWTEIASDRLATARVDEPAVAGEPVADATAVRAMLLVLESVSATPLPPEESRLRQAAAVAVQRAMGRARLALNRDVAPLLLPIDAASR